MKNLITTRLAPASPICFAVPHLHLDIANRVAAHFFFCTRSRVAYSALTYVQCALFAGCSLNYHTLAAIMSERAYAISSPTLIIRTWPCEFNDRLHSDHDWLLRRMQSEREKNRLDGANEKPLCLRGEQSRKMRERSHGIIILCASGNNAYGENL